MGLACLAGWSSGEPTAAAADKLASEFVTPPDSDRPWVYWWWLDGAASKEGITRDLEEMRRQGIGGFILVDAGQGGTKAPKGPPFMSEPWRENFRHAVREAGRLGLLMSVNLCSGWDAGGPWVQPEDAIQHLVSSETVVQGPAKIDRALPQPPTQFNWYHDIAVLACRVVHDKWSRERSIDLSAKMHDGRLQWDVPEGRWTILRLGHTLDSGKIGFGVSARTKFGSGPASEGWEINPWNAQAMDRHFEATAGKLIADAGPLAGKTFLQVHTDSWETTQPTWTQNFLDDFRKRRGYDALVYLPVLAGKTVDNAEITARFKWDVERTAADLFAANYYGRLGELARRHGMIQDSEAGGPFFFHAIDALQANGANEIPMGEFWKRTWEPDGPVFGTPDHYGFDCVRQASSAAHIYGRRFCQAEAMTSWSEDWIDDPWCLKDIGDHGFCDGVNRFVMHGFITQPRIDVVPGNQWMHVGTHLNPDVTWWPMSHAWLRYLQRCQYMLRQGLFVADVAYYYGENARNFVPAKSRLKPAMPAGYDYDTLNAEVLLTRASVKDGRLTLPDGMSYRCLVLPHDKTWKSGPAVLGKLVQFVEAGLTVLGPRPSDRAPGLTDYPRCDDEVRRLIQKLWGDEATVAGERRIGQGRLIWGKTLADVLNADRCAKDVEVFAKEKGVQLDWIHRRDGKCDMYFVANQMAAPVATEIAFRAAGRQPELWDAVTGAVRMLPNFREADGRVTVPMRFEPRQSFFVVFRQPVAPPTAHNEEEQAKQRPNFPTIRKLADIAGPWEVSFDPKWGGPEKVTFAALQDWIKRPETGIRYYSGTAVYRKTFDLTEGNAGKKAAGAKLYLNLGTVKNVATVKLNGRDLGVVWTAPWSVDITDAVKDKGNSLEIAVANLWPNRLIGDAHLPPEKRFTKTNVTTYEGIPPTLGLPGGCPFCDERKKTKDFDKSLLPSGLLGPVTVQHESEE